MKRAIGAFAAGLFAVALWGSEAAGQEISDAPIRLEIGGTPGGGLFFTGGDDDTEVNFNVYTFTGHAGYYLTERLAVNGEYMFGNGWGQDIIFRNGLVIGQQLPVSNMFTGGLMFFPKGTSGRLPYFVSGGVGLMSLVSRPTTKKVGYDPDVVGSRSFTVSRVGAGVNLPRGSSAPNWAFRLEYRLFFISPNDDAPQFFAHSKTRTGHQVQFGVNWAMRR